MKSHRKCDFCEKSFSGPRSKSDLQSHVKQFHTKKKEKKVITCDLCDKIFDFKSSFEAHLSNCQKRAKVQNLMKSFQKSM